MGHLTAIEKAQIHSFVGLSLKINDIFKRVQLYKSTSAWYVQREKRTNGIASRQYFRNLLDGYNFRVI